MNINHNWDKRRSTFDLNADQPPKKYWIIVCAVVSICFLALSFVLDVVHFEQIEEYKPLLKKAALTIFLVFFVLLVGKLIEKFILKKKHAIGQSYNLLRIIRLITNVLVFTIILSFLFQNWYTAAVSFGILSLILGFALQAPISSFIAWIYIIFRRPYAVGDRIQINGNKGDVVEIDYLDTTLLEFSGDYLGNDRRSGRIIRFPNSSVLKSEIFNYSGPQAPFIWNETAIQIGYTSDLKFVEKCLYNAAKQDFMEQHSFLDPKWEVMYEPTVYLRVNSYAWLEAVISYPVLPTETTPRRTRILKRALTSLNAEPGRVLFPEGAKR